MKAISSRLKALNEDLARKYKARNKLEALLPLKQFEPVSEIELAAEGRSREADEAILLQGL